MRLDSGKLAKFFDSRRSGSSNSLAHSRNHKRDFNEHGNLEAGFSTNDSDRFYCRVR